MKYKVTYIAKDGDCCSVWTEATSANEAKSNVTSEYRDIKEIVEVRKL